MLTVQKFIFFTLFFLFSDFRYSTLKTIKQQVEEYNSFITVNLVMKKLFIFSINL